MMTIEEIAEIATRHSSSLRASYPDRVLIDVRREILSPASTIFVTVRQFDQSYSTASLTVSPAGSIEMVERQVAAFFHHFEESLKLPA